MRILFNFCPESATCTRTKYRVLQEPRVFLCQERKKKRHCTSQFVIRIPNIKLTKEFGLFKLRFKRYFGYGGSAEKVDRARLRESIQEKRARLTTTVPYKESVVQTVEYKEADFYL